MPQPALKATVLNEQLIEWGDQLIGMPAIRPVLMISVLPGDTPQPVISTAQELEPKVIMNVLDVVMLQLRRQLAWDKVKGEFMPEE